MIRLLGLGAALPLVLISLASPAAARVQDTPPTAAEARMEAASDAFEARMEEFGKRAEALSEDPSLSEAQRGSRIAALWSEYAPDVAAFTTETAKHAGEMAAEALKNIDVDTLVADALNDPGGQTGDRGWRALRLGCRNRHRAERNLGQSRPRTDGDLWADRPICAGPGRRRRRVRSRRGAPGA